MEKYQLRLLLFVLLSSPAQLILWIRVRVFKSVIYYALGQLTNSNRQALNCIRVPLLYVSRIGLEY